MAQVVANKLLRDGFARHGAPSNLLWDRGVPLVSDLFQRVVVLLGTEHSLTANTRKNNSIHFDSVLFKLHHLQQNSL